MQLYLRMGIPGFVQLKRPMHTSPKHLIVALVLHYAHGSRTGMKIPLALADGPSIFGI